MSRKVYSLLAILKTTGCGYFCEAINTSNGCDGISCSDCPFSEQGQMDDTIEEIERSNND